MFVAGNGTTQACAIEGPAHGAGAQVGKARRLTGAHRWPTGLISSVNLRRGRVAASPGRRGTSPFASPHSRIASAPGYACVGALPTL